MQHILKEEAKYNGIKKLVNDIVNISNLKPKILNFIDLDLDLEVIWRIKLFHFKRQCSCV